MTLNCLEKCVLRCTTFALLNDGVVALSIDDGEKEETEDASGEKEEAEDADDSEEAEDANGKKEEADDDDADGITT